MDGKKEIEGNFHHIAFRDGVLVLLDQRKLPLEETYIECRTEDETAEAIKTMVVRGAPAIGIAASYGIALAAARHAGSGAGVQREALEGAARVLSATRPTAVNLFWAIEKMMAHVDKSGSAPETLAGELLRLAEAMHEEDAAVCRKIGDLGAELLPEESSVLTHCNAGALATAGYGTAGGVIRSGFRDGRVREVYVDETRPFLQGARLTAWELSRDGVPVVLITDNMAAHCMRLGKIDAVVVGADRVAANGDVANKIGTYGLAVLAREHKIPFYVAAPTSTIDMEAKSGVDIPIEERPEEEVRSFGGEPVAPEDVRVYNPAFDVTPARFVDALVTEKGMVRLSEGESLGSILG
ncbi:MAG: S-methyl-5-thioribose-1-phosphate isomerase [Nitrospinae bacterium]|nr:S-methyl-5-thioribose-1-phosphate isomerase [Nitrospinota bacterium]